MSRVAKLAANPDVQAALGHFQNCIEAILDLIISIQQIPAPTFHEAERAAFIRERFAALELVDVSLDDVGNVYGRYPGQGEAAPVVLSAHLDTVFGPDTDLTVKRNGEHIVGPGIGDNSTGIAGLLLLIDCLQRYQLRPAADLWFVANVGEEGLGDLRGARRLVERFGPRARYLVIEGGLFGQVIHQAIGVRRFEVSVEAQGGHSWGSFGNSSAIHVLGWLIAAIDQLTVPTSPKTTFNVGIIEGGTSINTIAQSARMLLDLRSESKEELARLEKAVRRVVRQANSGVEIAVKMSLIGDRPAGKISRDAPLINWAEAALRAVGCDTVEFVNGSTDANIALSQGLEAVCVGLTRAGNTHRVDEFIDISFLPAGLGQLLLLTLAAAEYS